MLQIKKRKRNCSLNNKGFSLVEVLIAVSILIVIAVPMALNLITSAQINSRAKQISSASDMAGSMMEVVQAVDLADILADMNGYDIDKNGDPLSYTISGDMMSGYTIGGLNEVKLIDGKYVPVTSVNSSILPMMENGVKIPFFVGNEQNNYAFFVSGIETEDIYFDVLTTFELERIYGNINLSDLNDDTTICVKHGQSLDLNVAGEFKRANDIYVALNANEENVATFSQTTGWYLANMQRTITIDVQKIDDETTKIVMTAKYVVNSDYLMENDKTIVKDLGSFIANSKSDVEDGVYLYYYPLFDSDVSRDSIVINNEDEVALSIHLIAKSEDKSIDFATISNYHPSVTVEELFGTDMCTEIHSNVENELWDRTFLPDGESFDVKRPVDTGSVHAFYSVMIQVYQHRESCYDDEGNFIPDSAHLLMEINGSCISKTYAPSEMFVPDIEEPPVEIEPWGLYDANGVQLASWKILVDYYGLDIESDYDYENYDDRISSLYYILHNFVELKDGVKLVIGNDVTDIGAYALAYCDQLTDVVVQNGVTTIGRAAFNKCTNLKNVKIPSTTTSIGDYVFNGCTSLTTITLPNSIASMGTYAFSDCSNLTSINIPTGVPIIDDGTFKNCTSLANITIPNNITRIGEQTFRNCTSLTKVVIPNSVTTIGGNAFTSCTNLISVTIPNSVTRIENAAFVKCAGLTSIVIPDSITTIEASTFSNCENLVNVIIPDSVTTISISAFSYCTSLETIDIPESVTSIAESVFGHCESLTSITIPSGVTNISASLFANCISLTNVSLPDGITSIGHTAFFGCDALSGIDLPDSVTSIGYDAFRDCDNLTSITIPSNVTHIGIYAFLYDRKLDNVVFENANGWWCAEDATATSGTRLSSSDLADSTKAAQYLTDDYRGYYWFCYGLEPGLYDDNWELIATWDELINNYGMDCEKDYTDETRETDTASPYCVLTNNTELSSGTKLIIDSSVVHIGNNSFAYSDLVSISFENGSQLNSVGDAAFGRCDNLTDITIPNSTTSIGCSAFDNCWSLTSIVIPESATKIGSMAFAYCDNLTSVYFANPSGWWYADSAYATSGTTLSAADLSNPTTAATCLANDYSGYYWFCGENTNGGVTAGELAMGDSVWLNVDGVLTEFLVVHQGNPDSVIYDDSCDGTWLLMKDIYANRVWDSSNNDYENSSIHAYMNGTFFSLFDSAIQSAIKQVKIPYVGGTGDSGEWWTGEYGLSTKIFLLSCREVGFGVSYMPEDGTKLDYFVDAQNSDRIASYDGAACYWWLRSPYTKDAQKVWNVTNLGASVSSYGYSASVGVRPAFILDSSTLITQSDGKYIIE